MDMNTQRHEVATLEDVKASHSFFFNDEAGATDVSEFDGEARPLSEPVTAAEVAVVLATMRNSRARGPDDTHGEYYKYSGDIVSKEYLARIMNQVLENNEQLAATQGSTLAVPIAQSR